jgi:hypothetical protein
LISQYINEVIRERRKEKAIKARIPPKEKPGISSHFEPMPSKTN